MRRFRLYTKYFILLFICSVSNFQIEAQSNPECEGAISVDFSSLSIDEEIIIESISKEELPGLSSYYEEPFDAFLADVAIISPVNLVGYSVDADTIFFEDGYDIIILNEVSVIDWCTWNPSLPQPSAGFILLHQAIKIKNLLGSDLEEDEEGNPACEGAIPVDFSNLTIEEEVIIESFNREDLSSLSSYYEEAVDAFLDEVTVASPVSLVGYSVDADTIYYVDGYDVLVLNEVSVIDWCTWDPSLPQPSAGFAKLNQVIKIKNLIDGDGDNGNPACNGAIAVDFSNLSIQEEVVIESIKREELPGLSSYYEDAVDTFLDQVAIASPASLVGYSVNSDTIFYENGYDVKILNEVSVIDWCTWNPALPQPSAGIAILNQVIKIEKLVDEEEVGNNPECAGITPVDFSSFQLEEEIYIDEITLRKLRTTISDYHQPQIEAFIESMLEESPQSLIGHTIDKEYDYTSDAYHDLVVTVHVTLIDWCNWTPPNPGSGYFTINQIIRIKDLVKFSVGNTITNGNGEVVSIERFDISNEDYNATLANFSCGDDLMNIISCTVTHENWETNEVELDIERTDNDQLNGISVLDLVKMNRHIVGSELLDRNDQLVAADINDDGRVSVIDVVLSRKMILGVEEDDNLNTASWSFYKEIMNNDSQFNLNDLTSYDLSYNLESMTEEDKIIAIKKGDLNYSATNYIQSENRSFTRANIPNVKLIKNERTSIPVYLDDYTVSLCGELSFVLPSALSYIGIVPGGFIIEGHHYIDATREIRIMWNNDDAKDIDPKMPMFYILVNSSINSNLSYINAIDYFGGSSYLDDDEESLTSLEFGYRNSPLVTSVPDKIVVYANNRNVYFNFPDKLEEVKEVVLFDVQGRPLKKRTAQSNENIQISMDNRSLSIIYYHILFTSGNTKSGSILLK